MFPRRISGIIASFFSGGTQRCFLHLVILMETDDISTEAAYIGLNVFQCVSMCFKAFVPNNVFQTKCFKVFQTMRCKRCVSNNVFDNTGLCVDYAGPCLTHSGPVPAGPVPAQVLVPALALVLPGPGPSWPWSRSWPRPWPRSRPGVREGRGR